jgi:hypothetical protein
MLLQRAEEEMEGDQVQSLQVRPNILEGQWTAICCPYNVLGTSFREVEPDLSGHRGKRLNFR